MAIKQKISTDVVRFFELEKSWVACMSHTLIPKHDPLAHAERENLRTEIYSYFLDTLDKRIEEERLK